MLRRIFFLAFEISFSRCVTVHYSALRCACVAVRFSVLLSVEVHLSGLWCIVVLCSSLQ
jgi:hypothetical protein